MHFGPPSARASLWALLPSSLLTAPPFWWPCLARVAGGGAHRALLTGQGSALLLGQAAHPLCCHSALPPCLDHRAEENLLPSHPEGFSTGTETGPTLSSQERMSVSLQQKLIFSLGAEHSLKLCNGKRDSENLPYPDAEEADVRREGRKGPSGCSRAVAPGSLALGGKWRELHQPRWQSRATGGLPEKAVSGSGIISFYPHHGSVK